MTTETKCIIAEQVCEGLMGMAAGTVVANYAKNHNCNAIETIGLSLGAMVAQWSVGRAFGKQFYKFCDGTFGTDFKDVIEKM